MTIDGVPGASCGEDETHVVLLAAFTAGLKVKDSHRGNARLISESGRFPFFLCEPRAFLVPSSFYRSLTTVHCPTWCFAAPPWLRPPSTPTEPFWRHECKPWSLLLVNLSWRYQRTIGAKGIATHWRPPYEEGPVNLPRADRRCAYQGACRDSARGSRPVVWKRRAVTFRDFMHVVRRTTLLSFDT